MDCLTAYLVTMLLLGSIVWWLVRRARRQQLQQQVAIEVMSSRLPVPILVHYVTTMTTEEEDTLALVQSGIDLTAVELPQLAVDHNIATITIGRTDLELRLVNGNVVVALRRGTTARELAVPQTVLLRALHGLGLVEKKE